MLVLWPFFIVYVFLFSSNYKIKLNERQKISTTYVCIPYTLLVLNLNVRAYRSR